MFCKVILTLVFESHFVTSVLGNFFEVHKLDWQSYNVKNHSQHYTSFAECVQNDRLSGLLFFPVPGARGTALGSKYT